MSILSDIQANTLSVRSGKNSIEQAIIDKGGTVEKEETLATFNELVTGIGSIQTSAGLNIFLQNTEPETKDGLWLKTTKTYDNIVTDIDIASAPYWNTAKMTTLRNIPFAFQQGTANVVGSYAYLLGTAYSNEAYKYNVTTDTYTQVTNTPYYCQNACSVAVGTDIYLFGGNYANAYKKYARKYDTLTDTYSSLTSLPNDTPCGGCDAIGDDIYIVGVLATNQTALYKYNITSNAYTQLSGITSYTLGSDKTPLVKAIGTNIYIFGIGSSGNLAYKYDTTTDSYTQLTNMPINGTKATATKVGTKIYIFGGSSNSSVAYEYDPAKDTYTQLSNMPYSTYDARAVTVGNEIYIFGGNSNTNRVQVMSFPTKTYANNSVVIVTNSSSQLETILIDTDVVNGVPLYFDDVLFYDTTNGFYTSMERYYGDGTQWNLI